MFIKIENLTQKEELTELFLKIEKDFGSVPPNFELLGNIDVYLLKDFLSNISKIANHKTINPNYFVFLRLFIANQENFKYCKLFNSLLLKNRGFSAEIIKKAKEDLSEIPFDEKHKLLAIKSLKAIFQSKIFNLSDFEELYKIGLTNKDIFDSIEHAGLILKNGRILTAYSIK